MQEIRNTEEAIDALTLHKNTGEGLPRAIYWAPGDMTRYVVALLAMEPLSRTINDGVTEMLFVKAGEMVLVIPKPYNEFSYYSASLFLTRFGDRYAGWWGGVRPILAGLGWTDAGDRNTVYSPGDAMHMSDAIRRRGLM